MNLVLRSRIYPAIIAIAAVCFIAGLVFAFQSGCAGDTKSGSFGSPKESLRLEEMALRCGLVGWLTLGLSALMSPAGTIRRRLLLLLAVAAPGFLLGFAHLQDSGVASCFAYWRRLQSH